MFFVVWLLTPLEVCMTVTWTNFHPFIQVYFVPHLDEVGHVV